MGGEFHDETHPATGSVGVHFQRAASFLGDVSLGLSSGTVQPTGSGASGLWLDSRQRYRRERRRHVRRQRQNHPDSDERFALRANQ